MDGKMWDFKTVTAAFVAGGGGGGLGDVVFINAVEGGRDAAGSAGTRSVFVS